MLRPTRGVSLLVVTALLGCAATGGSSVSSGDASARADGASTRDGSTNTPDGASTRDGSTTPDGGATDRDGAITPPDVPSTATDGGKTTDGGTDPADAGGDAGLMPSTCGPTERCNDGLDNACNGRVDEGCACIPGQTIPCYDGPPYLVGVGVCAAGTQRCEGSGEFGTWGRCMGSVLPSADRCDGVDRDCDGNTSTGCGCTVGTSRGCYTGPMGTAGVGTCREGVQRCVATSDGRGAEWATCEGQVLPAANLCDGIDRACTGTPQAGCECTAGATRACYSGAASTRNVGICRDGMQTCVVSGGRSMWPAACPGEARPAAAEVCGNRLDDNCDGMVDEGCGGTLTCPGDQTVPAGTAISLRAMGMGLTNITWTVVTAPAGGAGSVVWAPNPPTQLTESFTPYIVGTYTLRVSGVDSTGRTVTCMFNVTALPHGLRVQLTWNGTGDVDLHLHNATNSRWFAADDCYYGNLSPAWGAVLDFDNTSTTGPENIRVNTPAAGSTYTIGVHNYARAMGRVATVQIFCGSTTSTMPTATYTSRPFSLSGSGNCSNNDFWRVATVRFTSPTTCTITPLNTYTTGSAACTGF